MLTSNPASQPRARELLHEPLPARSRALPPRTLCSSSRCCLPTSRVLRLFPEAVGPPAAHAPEQLPPPFRMLLTSGAAACEIVAADVLDAATSRQRHTPHCLLPQAKACQLIRRYLSPTAAPGFAHGTRTRPITLSNPIPPAASARLQALSASMKLHSSAISPSQRRPLCCHPARKGSSPS